MSFKQLNEILSTNRLFAAKELNSALGIRNDYTTEVPFLQFPVPGPKGSAHAVALQFANTLDPSTVTRETVMMVVQGELGPIPAEVKVVDQKTILIQPENPLRQGRADDDLVYIIVTPNVLMEDGRRFAGISQRVAAG